MDKNDSTKHNELINEKTTLKKSLRGKSKVNTITPKQEQILKLLVKGMTNVEIAKQLNLSSKTVDAHRANMMTRLQIHDLAGLVKYALRNALTTLNENLLLQGGI